MSGIRTMLRRRGLLAVAGALFASLGLAGVASAATYNVNDTRDLTQSAAAQAAGTCVSTASTCTLRAAIEAANENGGQSTINLAPGTYPINSSTGGSTECAEGPDTDLTTGEFKINPANNSTQVTVIGGGSVNTVINAQGNDRIFDVFPNGVLDVQKTTLENATPQGCSREPRNEGGAIFSSGHLSAESDVFTGNSAASDGGAIAVDATSGSTMAVTSSVFQNNVAPDGGAIYTNAPNDVSVTFTLLQSNSGDDDGGAIFGDTGAAGLTLNFDDLVQNVVTNFGGGVYWDGNGALNITNSLFNQNGTISDSGGGIDIATSGCEFSSGSTPAACPLSPKNPKSQGFSSTTGVNVNVGNTSFDANSAASDGGGIYDGGSNGLSLTQDKFAANNAGGDGGAVELSSLNANPPGAGTTITSSEFDNNVASDDAGGAIGWEDAPLTLLGASFVLNKAAYGAALYAAAGSLLTMVDSTMSRNTATSSGGGIYIPFCGDGGDQPTSCDEGTLTNDTIAFNNAPAGSGAGIENPDVLASGGSAQNGFGVENTTIAQNSGGDCNTQFTSSFDSGNNNDSDQTCFGGLSPAGQHDLVGVNPMLFNPANNGGPTAGGPGDTVIVETDAEQSGSPTVDAGDNAGCPKVDERGVSRPQGNACDIGAYEFGAAPTTTTTTTPASQPGGTTTTSLPPPPIHKPKKCGKGKVRRLGKCVKQHRPHKHKHKHHKP